MDREAGPTDTGEQREDAGADAGGPGEAAGPVSDATVTVFKKSGGTSLSKHIKLVDGKPVSSATQCFMAKGKARVVAVPTAAALAALINRLENCHALAIGRLKGVAIGTDIVVVARKNASRVQGALTRTLDNMHFAPGQEAWCLIDYDQKGMPAPISAAIAAAGGFEAALATVLPAFVTTERVLRLSTSAGLSNAETGEGYPTSGGVHVYLRVKDGADIPRFVDTLFKRLWLAAFGWIFVSAAGQLLKRAPIDASVGSPERLCFEGPPTLEGLVQDKGTRAAIPFAGETLDTATLPSLKPAEEKRCSRLLAEAMKDAEPGAAPIRTAYVERLANDTSSRTGKPVETVRKQIEQCFAGFLYPSFPLRFRSLGDVTVDEVLRDPDRFIGERLDDPLEPDTQNPGCALLFRGRRDGKLIIKSFAHGGLFYKLDKEGARPIESVTIDDFYAYMPMHNYIVMPSREMWPAESVNSKVEDQPLTDENGLAVTNQKSEPIFISASSWLDQYRSVDQMSWMPGEPEIITDKVIAAGGVMTRKGRRILNLYIPPTIIPGDPLKAQLWIDHVRTAYPGDADHIIAWLAHRVQRPDEKVNHALVLGGDQGIGKDTLLDPARHGVGPWNFADVTPAIVMGTFNPFAKSVIMRVNEARDLGEGRANRFDFYEHMKPYEAAPPEVLPVNDKHIKTYCIPNLCGVIITTNHKTGGIHLSPDDRRHYVAWSELKKGDFTRTIGMKCGVGMRRAVATMWSPTSSITTSRASTRRPRRPRQKHGGASSSRGAHQRTRNSSTHSTSSTSPMSSSSKTSSPWPNQISASFSLIAGIAA
jgi:hypothetical protein